MIETEIQKCMFECAFVKEEMWLVCGDICFSFCELGCFQMRKELHCNNTNPETHNFLV